MGTDFDEAAKAAPPQDQDRDAAAAAPSSASPPACAPAPMPPPPPAAAAPQAPQPPPPAPAAVAPGYQPQYQQPPPQQPQQQQQLPGLQPLHAQHAPPPPLYQQTVLIKRQALPQVNDWNYGLLCCLQDVPLCCDVFCCQVCQQARLHDAVEESLNDSFNAVVCMGLCCAYMFIGGFACCLHGWFLRDSVRRSYGLAGNPCYDCLAATFCGCCMLCQTHRELRSHGVNPGGTFCCDFTTPIEHRPPVLVQSGFAMPPQQVQQQQPPPPPMPMQQPQWQQQQQQQPQWQQQQPWQQQQQQQPWGQQPPQSHQWQHPTAPPAQ